MLIYSGSKSFCNPNKLQKHLSAFIFQKIGEESFSSENDGWAILKAGFCDNIQ